MRYLVAVGVVLALAGSSVAAQSPSNTSPSEVAREFFAAQRDGRWLDAARLLDLKAFERQRTQDVANARRPRPAHHLTVEQVRRGQPTMPRTVTEYYVKQATALSREFNPLSYQYADITSADSLAALPTEVTAARWLEAKDPRWHMKEHRREFPKDCPLPSSAHSLFRPEPWRVIATTAAAPLFPESPDSVSYVLYRDSFPDTSDSGKAARIAERQMEFTPGVLTLVRIPSGWRVAPALYGGFGGAASGFGFSCVIADTIKTRLKKK